MVQAVAMLLIATLPGTNPWRAPLPEETTAPAETSIDTAWIGDGSVAEHQHQLDDTARRHIEPVHPTGMDNLRPRQRIEPVQPANYDDTKAARGVRLAQYAEDDIWPTASAQPAIEDSQHEFPDQPAHGTRPGYLDSQPAAANGPDPYAPLKHQNEDKNNNENEMQSTLKPQRVMPQPIDTRQVDEIPNESARAAPPPISANTNHSLPAATAPWTSSRLDPASETGATGTGLATGAPLQAPADLKTDTEGGGTLLLLAFFASVGLNLYLGWITWDTYNRYQDMVSDLRHSGTVARRERVEPKRGDRRPDRLVDSAAY